MPRIRTIKPEFFTSDQVVECSTNARLLFIGMWCFCDDSGVHPHSAKRLKMQVFPGDSIEVDPLIDELVSNGLLLKYEVEGASYLCVTGWHHQRIDKRQPPKWPGPPSFPDNSKNVPGMVDERSRLKGKEAKGRETIGDQSLSLSNRDRRADQSQVEMFDLSEVDWGHATSLAELAAKRVPPLTEADRRAWLKYGIIASFRLDDPWLLNAADATTSKVRRKPQAYFVTKLTRTAKDRSVELTEICRRIEIPDDIWNSTTLALAGAES